jgi:hypothetical protein
MLFLSEEDIATTQTRNQQFRVLEKYRKGGIYNKRLLDLGTYSCKTVEAWKEEN